MGLEDLHKVDAIGVERDSGAVVLTIADHWDWNDERQHLIALQDKLNLYIQFIESGELIEAYPEASGRMVRIDIIGRWPLPTGAKDFVALAASFAQEMSITIRTLHYPGQD